LTEGFINPFVYFWVLEFGIPTIYGFTMVQVVVSLESTVVSLETRTEARGLRVTEINPEATTGFLACGTPPP